MNRLLIIVGIVVLAILALVLLSPSSDLPTDAIDRDMTSTVDTDSTLEDTAIEPEAAAGPTIVDLAVQTESLSTLVAATVAAGLVDVIASDGPFTVLAPQNRAFDALPVGTLETLLEPENIEQLQVALSNHVISGTVRTTDLTDGMTVTTLAGEELSVEISAEGVITIGGATMVTADAEASNGVLHIIDTIIVPTT